MPPSSKNKCTKCIGYAAKSKYGWKRYFEERQSKFHEINGLLDVIAKLQADPAYASGIGKHLQTQISDTFKAAKKSIECNICLEAIEFKHLKSGKCGHHYCIECINHWLTLSNECPTCKKPNQF